MKKERIHVLVVEDEEAHAELVKRAFEDQEDVINLTVARNLDEARASLAESLPDLAIVDLFLPDGRGLELLDAEGNEYPVVIMTSHGDEEVAVEAMKAGALQYVVKSEIALSMLPQKVESAMRQWGHIVERKQAEERLHASEEHFRSLIENALDIITVVDADRRIQYGSPSFERILGFPAEERVGRDFLEFVHPDDRDAVATMIDKAFTEPPTGHLLYRLGHKDASWRFFEAVGSSYTHSTDGARGVINSRDVTDRQQAEEARRALEGQLRQTQKWEVVANLAGDIAREFHGKLNPILDYATMALQETAEGSKTRAGLERVLSATHRARKLAERIFVFSRREEPRTETLELGELVSHELETLKHGLPAGISLEEELDPDCPPVLADPEQMQEILKNLLSNAVHAMRDGGQLGVKLSHHGDDAGLVRLSVSDTGVGMDADTRRRAPEAFFTTKSATDSAGLGLSVTLAIVASHGGELTVRSEPQRGTTIHVDLPCA